MATDQDKQRRQRAIRELVERDSIASQQALVNILIQEGFTCTQASISRDMRELGLVKSQGKYLAPSQLTPDGAEGRASALDGLIIGCQTAGSNLIVIHTSIGSASVVALELDRESLEDIVGTLAGDDTVFVAVKSRAAQGRVLARLKAAIRTR